MNHEEAMKRSDEAIQELAKDLAQGKSEQLLRYLDFCSKFHRYSFRNQILIAMQRPMATLVAGFHGWRDLGRFVKKGEQGIAILAPILVKRSKKDSDAGNSPPQEPAGIEDPAKRRLAGFRLAYVFDVSQTDGAELPQVLVALVKGDPGDHLQHLEATVRSQDIELVDCAFLDGALGKSWGGKIEVLSTLDLATRFSVIAHEFAHELLHRGDRRESTTKILRETEAEAVAYILCRAVGFPPSNRSAEYIQLWSGDLELFNQSLELIRTVSTKIISWLEVEACPPTQVAPCDVTG